MQDKLKSFLNSLTWGEALELYKFIRTKKWQTWIDTIIPTKKSNKNQNKFGNNKNPPYLCPHKPKIIC